MGNKLSGICLAVFMTYGYSLADWADQGILSREAALYNEFANEYDEIYIFTYGTSDIETYADTFADNVQIIDQSLVGHNLLYSLCLPLLRWRQLRNVDVVKTNQMMGSWVAVMSSFLYRIPLLIRTGYILSNFAREKEVELWKRSVIYALEFVSYTAADGIITSSPHGKRDIEERYQPTSPHMMIPNYIETSIFRPLDLPVKDGSICFVGRLDEQKNLSALIQAVGDLPYSLTIVGSGSLRDDLAEHASVCGADVEFKGRVPNHQLPELINRHEIFCLPSHYEGMPKSLLEAMACGVAVVGTDVPGTRDVIDDGVDGLLCETTASSLRATIERVLENDDLRFRLGQRARETVVEQYSLERVVDMETALVARIVE